MGLNMTNDIPKHKIDLELRNALLADFHRLMIEALRLREQDVFRYIAILAPALAGFIWLLASKEVAKPVFAAGTVGVVLLLCVGALYAVALGYNYRYVTLQLAKLRTKLEISDYALSVWPADAKTFGKKHGRWCSPPEVIRVFWLTFLTFMIGVTAAAWTIRELPCEAVIICVLALLLSFLSPAFYGSKLQDTCDEEPPWHQEASDASLKGEKTS